MWEEKIGTFRFEMRRLTSIQEVYSKAHIPFWSLNDFESCKTLSIFFLLLYLPKIPRLCERHTYVHTYIVPYGQNELERISDP